MFPENEGDGEEMLPPGEEQDDQEQSSKTMIGILIKEDSGVYIAKVTGENAKKAGFQEGDKVVSIEGKDIATSNDLISEVQSHKPGDTVAVTVERNGQPVEIKTELE
jgi:S1-C subfamily serine protease